MRYLVGPVLFLCSPVFVYATDTGNPNVLTPEEIADGWVLLFDGRTTFGWKIEGGASVTDGSLVLEGKRASRAIPSAELGNCEIRLEYMGGMQLVFAGGGTASSLGLSSPAAWQAFDCKIAFDPARSTRGVSFTSNGNAQASV